MAHQINPGLADELHAYGASDADKCFNCGNCSAVCVHSEAPHILPRRPMHAFQLGLEDKLKGSLEPWMCYYCGECSEQCPKEAEPGETMMSMRRWLTSKYDFSGLSGLFYRSPAWEIIAIVFAAILTAIGFIAFGSLERRQLLRLRRRERLAAGALRAPLRLGDGDRARPPARHQRAAHVALRDEGLGRRHRLVPGRDTAAAVPLLHAGQVPPVRAQAPVGGPPRADAELRDDARPDHVLPVPDAVRAEHRLARARVRVPGLDRPDRRGDPQPPRAA